jgi:NAD(P)-dependent dehydrogenase (short-subunit alcohol dehydrogenase family)
MTEMVVARHGRIDVLVNNAGINDRFLPVHALDDETWLNVMGVNVNGVMMLCPAVVPGMMERKSGAIVTVSSIGGLGGGASGFAYTTSKHAVIGMTRSIAWTYRAAGIRCNAVCPGGVVTNIGSTSIPRDEWAFEQLKPRHAGFGKRIKLRQPTSSKLHVHVQCQWSVLILRWIEINDRSFQTHGHHRMPSRCSLLTVLPVLIGEYW